MLDRREFLELLAMAALAPAACVTPRGDSGAEGVWVNDIHSQLNRTRVARIVKPRSIEELRRVVRGNDWICIAGGRHAMGGQQFASNATLIDMNGMTRVLALDDANGIIDVETGIQWPELIASLKQSKWSIRQKQTGADRLSIGGGIGANVHGRGLTMQPLAGDIESLTLLDANGELHECSRTKNTALFSHVLGGYGLFGVVAAARLRLMPKRKLQRIVEVEDIANLVRSVEKRVADGFLYGDFQFSIDHTSPRFLRQGVFSCYKPVSDDTPMPEAQAELKPEDWMRLLYLAHADKREAFERYVGYYVKTTGQLYWSDEHQLSFYPDDYHLQLDALLKSARATEMITELYVPRERLEEFMTAAAEELRRLGANVIYGTVRFIERDDVTVLPWAKQSYACIVMNLHVEHGAEGEARAAEQFRALIDLALARDGNYFLTYHRWARRDQVERGYPNFAAFLRDKREADPKRRFTSEWYRHYEAMFGA